ncbi:MAG: TolB family protein [Anaerolineae bacterium]|nr:TolB family protein [Anaerolineae bacterium]
MPNRFLRLALASWGGFLLVAASLLIFMRQNATITPYILYDQREAGFGTIIRRDLSTRTRLPLTDRRLDASTPFWSPGYRWVAFQERTLDSNNILRSTISLMYPDGSHQRRLTNPMLNGHWHLHGWSPDGRWLLVTSAGNYLDSEIFRIHATTGAIRAITRNQVEDRYPAWSPDGRWIAYISNQSRQDDLYRVSIDGQQIERLTRDAAREALPTWSQDSVWVVFAAHTGRGVDLYRVAAAGGPSQRLTFLEAGSISLPQRAPGQDRFAFTLLLPRQSQRQLMLIDGDGGNLTLASHQSVIGDPIWSADGRWLYFFSPNPVDRSVEDLYRVAANASAPGQVVETAVASASARISPAPLVNLNFHTAPLLLACFSILGLAGLLRLQDRSG